jgi:hypothetical protein
MQSFISLAPFYSMSVDNILMWIYKNIIYVGMLISFWLFLFAAQPKEFSLDGLKKLEQRSHKCVELKRGICRVNTFCFNPVACWFLYKAKDLSALPHTI